MRWPVRMAVLILSVVLLPNAGMAATANPPIAATANECTSPSDDPATPPRALSRRLVREPATAVPRHVEARSPARSKRPLEPEPNLSCSGTFVCAARCESFGWGEGGSCVDGPPQYGCKRFISNENWQCMSAQCNRCLDE